MFKITFLGNCASVTAEREGVCFVVEADGLRILVDASPGVVSRLYQAEISPVEIDAVVVTHCHGDHILGFPYFVFANFYERAIERVEGPAEIQLIALPETIEGLRKMLEICNYDVNGYPFSIADRPVTGGEVLEVGSVTLSPVPVEHSVPNLGFRFDSNGRSATYSSDTVYCERLVQLAEGSDLLIHEAMGTSEMKEMLHRGGHSVSQDAARAAVDSEASRLAITHMLPPLIGKEQVILDEIKQVYPGPAVAPADLDVLEV
jgi:ribonuclease Z